MHNKRETCRRTSRPGLLGFTSCRIGGTRAESATDVAVCLTVETRHVFGTSTETPCRWRERRGQNDGRRGLHRSLLNERQVVVGQHWAHGEAGNDVQNASNRIGADGAIKIFRGSRRRTHLKMLPVQPDRAQQNSRAAGTAEIPGRARLPLSSKDSQCGFS